MDVLAVKNDYERAELTVRVRATKDTRPYSLVLQQDGSGPTVKLCAHTDVDYEFVKELLTGL